MLRAFAAFRLRNHQTDDHPLTQLLEAHPGWHSSAPSSQQPCSPYALCSVLQGPFDAAFFNLVFNLVEDQRETLLHAALLLKPGVLTGPDFFVSNVRLPGVMRDDCTAICCS